MNPSRPRLADAPPAPWHVNQDPALVTRHPEPRCEWTNVWDVEGFDEISRLRNTAIHEAAHAVAFCLVGAGVLSIRVRTVSEVARSGANLGSTYPGDRSLTLKDTATALAVGERAVDRWLRRTDQWTPERAWAAEACALGDRLEIAQIIREATGEELTFGVSRRWNDLSVIHERADRMIVEHWAGITRLAEALVVERNMNSLQVQLVTGIPNPVLR